MAALVKKGPYNFSASGGKAEIVTICSLLCHNPFTYFWQGSPDAGKYKPIPQSLPGSLGQDLELPPRAMD